MSLLDNLPHRCSILIRNRNKGGLGGSKDELVIVSTNVVCWIQPLMDYEVMRYGRINIVVTTKVLFVDNPSLTEQHIIRPTSPARIAGRDLEVRHQSWPDTTAGTGVLYRVVAEEVSGQYT